MTSLDEVAASRPRLCRQRCCSRLSWSRRVVCGSFALLTLAACSSSNLLSNPGRMLQAPDFSAFSPLRAPPNPGRQPITPTDLVNADGLCAGAADAQPVVSADAAPGMPPALPGVALEMSECEVVRRTGRPQEVRIGANEHGDRTAVLIYREGVRPGIYRFRSGRLVSIERGAEPVVDAKPKKPAKKRRSPAG